MSGGRKKKKVHINPLLPSLSLDLTACACVCVCLDAVCVCVRGVRVLRGAVWRGEAGKDGVFGWER